MLTPEDLDAIEEVCHGLIEMAERWDGARQREREQAEQIAGLWGQIQRQREALVIIRAALARTEHETLRGTTHDPTDP